MRRTKPYLFVVMFAALLARTRAAEAQNLSDTEWVKPLMMLLVDTSGSMERRIDEPGQPIDRLPQCASNPLTDQRNRWAWAVEALTGRFVETVGSQEKSTYQCKTQDRSKPEYAQRFDYNYFIPHINFDKSFDKQEQKGILDIHRDKFKFGLMTFDGISTTTTGLTLVKRTDYTGSGDVVNGPLGMYSYPLSPAGSANVSETGAVSPGFGWKALAFPGCGAVYGVNAGVRSPDGRDTVVTGFDGLEARPGGADGPLTAPRAGALISVGKSDSVYSVRMVNERIQKSLKYTRPYGGTPIAAMLDDFQAYLDTDDDVKKGSDPFYGCRRRFGVLLTDGAPDSMYRDDRFQCWKTNDPTCPEIDPVNRPGVRRCQCPYDTEENLASKLVSTSGGLEQLWVVAFNVDEAALKALNRIAWAGSPQGRLTNALEADTGEELIKQLSNIMEFGPPISTSRSVPTVVNTGRPVTLGGAQYVISAGFQVGQDEEAPWQGRLFRQRVECDGTVATTRPLDAGKQDLFHFTLRDQSDGLRVLHTVRPLTDAATGNLYAGSQAPALVNNTDNTVTGLLNQVVQVLDNVLKALLGIVTVSEPPAEYSLGLKPFDRTLPRAYFGAGLTDDQFYDIVDFTRGTTTDRTVSKLSDIIHSNPAVLPPVVPGSDLLNAFDPTLRDFYSSMLKEGTGYGAAGRPGVVFVASNDGVLHAFNLEAWDKYKAGQELWGFVPPALFKNMYTKRQTKSHSTPLFDGSPLVKDVLLSKSPTEMRTVLVSALRSTPTYVALDVTRPEAPKFLWQRTFNELGQTVATPAIAQVRVKLTTGLQPDTRAVAILPGGKGVPKSPKLGEADCPVDDLGRGPVPNGGRTRVRCWERDGRYVFVVDIKTGALLQQFDFRHFPSPMTGSVVVDGEGLGLTRAAYMTDEDGVLWRLSMMQPDPSKWRIAPIWDLFAGKLPNWKGESTSVVTPIAEAGRVATYPPVLVRDPKSANLTILVGTGDIDDVVNARPNRVVSLQEVRKIAPAPDGELIVDASNQVTLNWGIQLDPYESVTGPVSVLDDVAYFTTFTGPSGVSKCLVGDSKIVGAHVRTKDASGLPVGRMPSEDGMTKSLWYTPSAAPKALLLGLNVSPDPVCVQIRSDEDKLFSGGVRATDIAAASRGSYQLRTMVAGQGDGTVMAGSNAGGTGAQKQLTRSIGAPNVARSVGWASSIE